MKKQVLRTTIAMLFSHYTLYAGCANGACGVTVPQIPTDLKTHETFKPFYASKKDTRDYRGWVIVDNAGDEIIGTNRIMAGGDVVSLLKSGDKLSVLGMLTDESLKSGKVSYTYPIGRTGDGTFLQLYQLCIGRGVSRRFRHRKKRFYRREARLFDPPYG